VHISYFFIGSFQYFSGFFEKQRSRVSEVDRFDWAFEQLHAQLILQVADLPAERRLGYMQLQRGARRFPSQPPPRNSASASVPRAASSMPLSYAETRNIVFLKSAVLGRSLLIEKKGTYEWNHQSN